MNYKRERQGQADHAMTESADASRLAAGKRTLVETEIGVVQRKAKDSRSEVHAPITNGRDPWTGLDDIQYPPGSTAEMFRDVVEGMRAADIQRRGGENKSTEVIQRAAALGISGSSGTLPFLEQIQRSFGAHDLSNVKAHTDTAAAAGAAAMGAEAYTTGEHVVFAGPPSLHTAAHEAAHVVQQRAGVQLKGGVGAIGDAYEQNADAVADRVVRGESATDLLDAFAPRSAHGLGANPPVQAKSDQNYFAGELYNKVEISDGVEKLKFIDLDPGAVANYPLGNHWSAQARGWNSVRDGNFGAEHSGPAGKVSYNFDGFRAAKWNYPTRMLTGGAGPHTLSMHNWAFENISVSSTFHVVPGVEHVKPGPILKNVPALDAKVPIMVSGPTEVTISQAEVVKVNRGWSVGQSINQSTSVTRSITAGLSVGLEQKDVAKVGAEAGISSSNTKTVVDQINHTSAAARTDVAKVGGSIKVKGNVDGTPVNKYVIPVYNVYNFEVTAYPHTKDGLVTGPLRTTNVAYLVFKDLQEIPADEEGKMVPDGTPSHASADEKRQEEEAKGKVLDANGKWIHLRVLKDEDMIKDYDHQDYTNLVSGGVEKDITKEWNSELQNSFSITDSNGVKVSSTGGWNIGVSGGAGGAGKDSMGPSAGVKVGVSEMTTVAAEYGDVNAQSGATARAAEVKTSIKVKGTDDPHKTTQVIVTPILREKVYEFSAYDKARATWERIPAKARSRTYHPVPAVTTKEIPRGSAAMPEGAPKLHVGKLDGTAEEVKKLREERDKIKDKDPARAAELDAKIEGKLVSQREALEEVVRKIHSTLEVIDRSKNLYRIFIDVPNHDNVYEKRPFVGTLEALMDLSATTPSVHTAADKLATKDVEPTDNVTIEAQGGLGGTGSQGRMNPFPGDVDLSESIRITAPTADAAANAFAAALKQTVIDAQRKPTDGSTGYLFLKALVGQYPPEAKQQGPISWSESEIVGSQKKSFKGKDGKNHEITLAQAIASPGSRAANTHWRGPIDSSGTYGEITKVLNYEAVTANGTILFASPKIGQGYQEVGFGTSALKHDTERTKLLDALTPQIAKYAKDKNWVKALKRAYTVARMLNDLAALNDFAMLMRDEASELKTVTEHVTNFNEDIVSPSGKATSLLDAKAARRQAELLVHRLYGIEGIGAKVGSAMEAALKVAGDDIRANASAHALIEKRVIEPLDTHLNNDKEYARKVASALRAHGYLREK